VHVAVEEAGHHRAPSEIDRPRVRWEGPRLAYGGDASVSNGQRRAHLAAAIDELAIRQHEIAKGAVWGAGARDLLCSGSRDARRYANGSGRSGLEHLPA
jgi:hypothetical protein